MQKLPIYILFNLDKFPKSKKKIREISFPSNFIFKQEGVIYVCLHQIAHLDKMQKNFYLFNVGKKLRNFCNDKNYEIKYFGDNSLNINCLILGWHLMEYSFDNFKTNKTIKKKLNLISKDKTQIELEKEAYFFIRDIINTPANILGPNEILKQGKVFLKKYFSVKKITGMQLRNNFPLIYEVGKAASSKKQPIFCEFKSKSSNKKKKIILIGKGVSFDTGGLNLKTGSGMILMKKDMGGAANCIGLANLIKSTNPELDVTLLLSLVENSVSANSFRPSDILKSRDGQFIEIGDTDAEGRLILADAISYACESKPDLIIDMATLTGASRVAMGVEVPSYFCNSESLSKQLQIASEESGDPLWALPLWDNYSTQLNSNHADVRNIGNSSFGGAITAALFLNRFVKNQIPWIHVDLMGWSFANKFSSYVGGEAMGIRALHRFLINKFS